MRKYIPVFFIGGIYCLITVTSSGQTGKVGINTTTPAAMLHVKDSSVVFTGAATLPVTPGNPPVSGAGARMMWYPDKAAFRVGFASAVSWDKQNIGNFSFAVGHSTSAYGDYSTAMGNVTTALGDYSTAMGYLTRASGFRSTAMGHGTEASGSISTAMGVISDAFGDYSTAMGYSAHAVGDYSTAIGYGPAATGDFSTAMGSSTVARSYGSLSIGRYNDSVITSSPTSWISTDPVFIIGNGADNNNRSNALTILNNGKTGINVVSPEATLHIKNTSVSENHLVLHSSGNFSDRAMFRFENNRVIFQNTQSGGSFWDFRDHTGATKIIMGSNGDIDMKGDLTLGPFRSLGVNTTSPSAPLHVISNAVSGGSSHSKAIMILEDNDQGYLQFSNPNAEEAGILSGNNVSTIRSAFIFGADSSVTIRTGGNNSRMRISKTGRVGINLTDPVAGLDIKGYDGTTNSHIRLEDDNSTDFANFYYTGDLILRNNRAGGDFYFRNDAGTNILSLFESGNMTILGTLTQNSDARLKKNISPLQNSLKKILSLGGYHYSWIDATRDNSLQTGLLAQQVETQMPELIKTNDEGIKSVNYNGLIPYLVEAIKELKQANDVLKKEIQLLKKN
jgi:hypothetical protein